MSNLDVASYERTRKSIQERESGITVEDSGLYVFDGNRVTAHRIRKQNGKKDVWKLHTVDPDVFLVISPTGRVRKYSRCQTRCVIRVLRQYQHAGDVIVSLEKAKQNCKANGHGWSPLQRLDATAFGSPQWQWCLVCGAEQVWFPDERKWLLWPADVVQIDCKVVGTFPRLHGSIAGGVR